jgi:hypothetical protein
LSYKDANQGWLTCHNVVTGDSPASYQLTIASGNQGTSYW